MPVQHQQQTAYKPLRTSLNVGCSSSSGFRCSGGMPISATPRTADSRRCGKPAAVECSARCLAPSNPAHPSQSNFSSYSHNTNDRRR